MTEVNKLVIEVFIWQLVIALITGMLNMTLESSYQDFMKYLPSTSFWIITMTWWLLMTYFVPISLMVTL
jgi:predicted membrane protein